MKCLQSWITEGIAKAAATRGVQPKKAKKENDDEEKEGNEEEEKEEEEEEEDNQKTGQVGIPLKFTPAFADDFFGLREYILKEANKLMDPSLDREVGIFLIRDTMKERKKGKRN